MRYKIESPNTRLFITGVPLSGKSTLTPLLNAKIEGISSQNMDILRIVAIAMENLKPEPERDIFVTKGSCDSYLLIGDGKYSPPSLIEGYKKYSQAVCELLKIVIPQLEAQGAQNMIFEGVQLMPSLIAQYLNSNSRLIIVLSNPTMLKANAMKIFGQEEGLLERYNSERLIILQEEIQKQGLELPSRMVIQVENDSTPDYAAQVILAYLQAEGIISL